ncbi:MAG: AAA family ATPase [Janthinobacterium lividum]
MKIKDVRLIDFKRFTDLRITDIPETVRLVILVGPNGSGKSSVFDGFNVRAFGFRGRANLMVDYHIKFGAKETGSLWFLLEKDKVHVDFHDVPNLDWRSSLSKHSTRFYIRTGYRYEPEFTVDSIRRQGPVQEDNTQPERLIEIEGRVSKNYERLIAQSVADIFDSDKDDAMTKREIRDRIIGKISESFQRVLPDAQFAGLGNPLENGTFFFKKGVSENWPYSNLSAGEKATFDLILDFIIKSDAYNDTVYCIDEPEVHINTNVHSALLGELYTSLPGQSQLWIATHSASMMRKARELEENNPGTVVFLDFAGHDFDQPVILRPAVTNREFWQKNFSVAIGELAALVAPTQVFFCEGDPNGRKKKEFDSRCYSAIFSTEFPDAVFLSVGSSNEVRDKAALLSGVFSQFLKGVQTVFIIDRDDYSDSQRQEILDEGNKMLERRHLEVYLLDDELLIKLCVSQGKSEVWPALFAEKQQLLAASATRGNPSDDWKSIGESMRQAAKKLLSINQIGSNADAFMLDYLVPLISPNTNIYQKLRQEIFG